MAEPYMRIEKVVKKFGPFTAINGVDLEVYPGEVHALLGDNGVGKSTLIKTLAGVHEPTSGQFFIEGKPVKFRSPRDASAAGIGMVYQELAVNHLMSVTRNFFMGRELKGMFGKLRMDELEGTDIRRLMAGGAEMADLEQELAGL